MKQQLYKTNLETEIEEPSLETAVEEDDYEDGGADHVTGSGNEIAIGWGDLHITVRGDYVPLDEIEDKLFSVLERLKASLNGDKLHDMAVR